MLDDGQEHGRGLPPTIPPPEWIDNVTCYSPLLVEDHLALEKSTITAWNVIKALMIIFSTCLSLAFNIVFITSLNSKYYSKWLRPQPRFILCTMVINDLASSILVMGLGIFPAMFQCWPFGERFCQIQALFRGAFTQQSATILIILAIERYLSSVHYSTYNKICSTKVCIFVISLSWLLSFSLYTLVVLPPGGFHFNLHGLMICEPYYLSSNAVIVAACLFYFPTTMVLMYCYGTIFHASKSILVSRTPNHINKNPSSNINHRDQGKTNANNVNCHYFPHRNTSDVTYQSTAAISITFIIVVTPWAIQKVITSYTRTFAPPTIEFTVSWLAGSHKIWSPIIYWIFNAKFRKAVQLFFITKVKCRHLPGDWSSGEDEENFEIPMDENQYFVPQDGEISSRSQEVISSSPGAQTPPSSGAIVVHPGNLILNSDKKKQRTALLQMNEIAVREKYWGEILERTLSSQNLVQMHQRISKPDGTLANNKYGKKMNKTLSGSTPHLIHHNVSHLKSDKAEMARRAIVEKYLSPQPPEVTNDDDDKNEQQETPLENGGHSCGKIRRRCHHHFAPNSNHDNNRKLNSGSSQGGNCSSGSGSSASRKPTRIHGATSLYSLRSLSKEEDPSKSLTNRISLSKVKKLHRESSFDQDTSLALPESRVEEIKESNEAEDSDGLWGDDEDDDDIHT